ncbi:DUF6301 family protein [Nocardia pseudobrasiliensis]|uniref:DUF6301 family protein n=1 Tax=Nocardia pseudobrasiliensis TaxID=45979 RepID=UPI0020D27F9E|nr:DUF6301 family protein [Nocardia pseudobrasiliensis]
MSTNDPRTDYRLRPQPHRSYSLLDRFLDCGPRPVDQVWFYFTDVVLNDSSTKPLLSNAFDALAQRIFVLVGQLPTGWWWRDPNRMLRWDVPGIVLKITVSDGSGNVSLVSPEPGMAGRNDDWIEPEAHPDLDSVWPQN